MIIKKAIGISKIIQMRRLFFPFFAFFYFLNFFNSAVKSEVIFSLKNSFNYLNSQNKLFIKSKKNNQILLSNNKIASLKKEFNKQLYEKWKKIDNCNFLERNEIRYKDNYWQPGGQANWGLTFWDNNSFTVYKYGPYYHDLDYNSGKQGCERLGAFKFEKVYTDGYYQYEFYYALKETEKGSLFEVHTYKKEKKYSMIKSLRIFSGGPNHRTHFSSEMDKISWKNLKPLN